MKCLSCQTEINPQWKHAIDMNVCPFCGKHIMEEHMKNLFSNLRETMDALQTYPDQLNDWMLSNHNYIKTDSPDIGKYIPQDMLKDLKKLEDEKSFQARKDGPGKKEVIKIKNAEGQEEEVVVQKIQSEDRTNEFFKRAEVIKAGHPDKPKSPNDTPSFQSPAEKTAHLKNMAQQIKKEGSKGLAPGGGSITLPPDMLEEADPEAVAEWQQILSGGEVSSSLDESWDGDDDLPGGDGILQANMAIAAAKAGGGSSGDYNAKDAAHLARLQGKVSNARKAMKGGGGSFSRG